MEIKTADEFMEMLDRRPIGCIITNLELEYRKQKGEVYLECDGSYYDVVKYPELLKALDNAKLPDTRGLLIQGLEKLPFYNKNYIRAA